MIILLLNPSSCILGLSLRIIGHKFGEKNAGILGYLQA